MYQMPPLLSIAQIESQLQMLKHSLTQQSVMAPPNLFGTLPQDDQPYDRRFENYQFNPGTTQPEFGGTHSFRSNLNFAHLVDPQNPTHAMAILDGLLLNQGMPTLTQLNALAQTGVITYDPRHVGGQLSVMGFTEAVVFDCVAPNWEQQLLQYFEDKHLKQFVKEIEVFEFDTQKQKVLVVCNPNTRYVKPASFQTHQILESVGLVPVAFGKPASV